ncbi:MAG: galactokinase [Candidatus Sulfotelmatobacter sp.]|jgi:galactokinase
MSRNKQSDLLAKFQDRFQSTANLYRAPGRVNLIGEHTDYNDGFVLPAAIGFSCWIAIAPRNDRKLVLYSENFDESVEAELDNLIHSRTGSWPDYPLGVAWTLQRAGYHLTGADIYILGEVPLGAGLSSSAAVEVSVGYALLDIAGHAVEPTKLALLCQQAENEFVGARCGIMDQFVSCHGRSGAALFLDCRSLGFHFVPISPAMRLVICNTMVRHNLSAGKYNARREECEAGVHLLSKRLPAIRALRDVSIATLDSNRDLLGETIYKRCRHVVSENLRTQNAANAFQSGDIEALNGLMTASHQSLRDDFEVSCRELDLMVEIAMRQSGVLGARMTGGGFGGCTINLVNAAHADDFCKRVAAEYETATGLHPDIYISEASQGAEKMF